MKKRIEKLIESIKGAWYDYGGGTKYCIANGNGKTVFLNECRGIITTSGDLPGTETAHSIAYDGPVKYVADWEVKELKRVELPEKEAMRKSIHAACNGKRNTVTWCKEDGCPIVNARFVFDGIVGLNARYMWYSDKNSPVYMFDGDDFNGTVYFFLPIRASEFKGFGYFEV